MNDFKTMYDKRFLRDTLAVMEDELKDLEAWSAYNDDKEINAIVAIKILFDQLKKQVSK